MKKILFMVTSMNIGGVEKSLLSLLSVLPKEKYDVTLLLLEKKGGFLKYIPKWVRVEEVSWFKHIKPIIMQPPQQTIKNYIQSKKFMKIPTFTGSYLLSKHLDNRYFFYQEVFKTVPQLRDKYDIAISYQGPTDVIDYYIAFKVDAKKKISWVHFDVSKHIINVHLYKKLYKEFNQINVVSKEAEKRLVEKIPDVNIKTRVVLNILPKNMIIEMGKSRVDIGNDEKEFKLVTVGRLSKEKGQELAIRALYKLKSDGYNVRWYCIGEGNQRKEYEKLIEDFNLKNDFLLLGATTNPYPYIALADIYVQTSLHEGYCLTLAEAKCLKKPIVTTDFIGAYEQIESGHNGWIVRADVESLYQRIKILLDEPLQRQKLIKQLSIEQIDNTVEVDQLII